MAASLLDFRTIQVHPKDRLTRTRQAPDASNRLRGGGTWEGAHARHEATGVRSAALLARADEVIE